VFVPRGLDTLRCDALDRLIHEGVHRRHVVAVVSFEIAAFQGHPARAEAVIFGNQAMRSTGLTGSIPPDRAAPKYPGLGPHACPSGRRGMLDRPQRRTHHARCARRGD
jgi:hypothetical protein